MSSFAARTVTVRSRLQLPRVKVSAAGLAVMPLAAPDTRIVTLPPTGWVSSLSVYVAASFSGTDKEVALWVMPRASLSAMTKSSVAAATAP